LSVSEGAHSPAVLDSNVDAVCPVSLWELEVRILTRRGVIAGES
jgi:hypothetical protein